MGTRYAQPQSLVRLNTKSSLTIGAHIWSSTSPRVLFGKKTLQAVGETAYNSSPIGDQGIARKWSKSANAGIDFGTNQIITQNSGVTVLVVATPTATASMKVPFSQRIGSGNYTQTDFTFNATTIDSLGATSGQLALTTYHAGSGGVLATGQIDGKTHCWVAGNGPSNGYIFRDGIKQVLSTSTRTSTFTASTQKLRIGNIADDTTSTYPCDDPLYLVVVWDRLLSESEAQSVSANPWQLFEDTVNISTFITNSLLPTTYTITAQGGSYTKIGATANILKSKLITTVGGFYSKVGTSAIINFNRLLTAQSGNYIQIGTDVTIFKNRNLITQGGMYVKNGSSVNINYTGLSNVYSLTCVGGSYTKTGSSALILKSKMLIASSGTYTYTGNPVVISYSGTPPASGLLPYLNVLNGEFCLFKSLT